MFLVGTPTGKVSTSVLRPANVSWDFPFHKLLLFCIKRRTNHTPILPQLRAEMPVGEEIPTTNGNFCKILQYCCDLSSKGLSFEDRTGKNDPSVTSMTSSAQSGTATAQSGTAIAQSGTAIAQSGTAIAQSGTAIAQSGTAIAQSETAIAQSGTATAQSGTSPFLSEFVPKYKLSGQKRHFDRIDRENY